MGAMVFQVIAEGANANEAFAKARAEALHEYGHGGYSGTIAEKRSFILLDCREERLRLISQVDKALADASATEARRARWRQLREELGAGEAKAVADALIDLQDDRVDDKWGPAACFALGGARFLFFGWASS